MSEVKEIQDVSALLLAVVGLIDHWVVGLEAGLPKDAVIAVMKESSANLRGQALKP